MSWMYINQLKSGNSSVGRAQPCQGLKSHLKTLSIKQKGFK